MATTSINYTAFVQFLDAHPDVLALKRFRGLHIRNLLFYQAELAHLEVELQEIEDRDAKDSSAAFDRVNYRWKPSMAEEAAMHTSKPTFSSEYCEKIIRIRKTLESYSGCLLTEQSSLVSNSRLRQSHRAVQAAR